jgi:hypothetical protein
MKGTKFNRLLFQLVPKTHRTVGIDVGSSEFIPTPQATDYRDKSTSKSWESKGGVNFSLGNPQIRALLPTPTVMDSTNATATMKSTQVKEGSMHSVTLSRMLLNTPRTSDKNMHWKTENWKGDDLGSQINELLGTRSHLNPRFVAEMMGFPPNWTELPFLNGETKA